MLRRREQRADASVETTPRCRAVCHAPAGQSPGSGAEAFPRPGAAARATDAVAAVERAGTIRRTRSRTYGYARCRSFHWSRAAGKAYARRGAAKGKVRTLLVRRTENPMRSFRRLQPCAAIAVAAGAFASGAPVAGFPPALQPADLVLRDATIATLDLLQPDAQAIAIRDGRIEAVGSNDAV